MEAYDPDAATPFAEPVALAVTRPETELLDEAATRTLALARREESADLGPANLANITALRSAETDPAARRRLERWEVLRRRMGGQSIEAIGEVMGLAGKQVKALYQESLDAQPAEEVAAERKLRTLQLEAILARSLPYALGDHDDEFHKPSVQYIDRVLATMRALTKLNGTEAPQRLEIDSQHTETHQARLTIIDRLDRMRTNIDENAPQFEAFERGRQIPAVEAEIGENGAIGGSGPPEAEIVAE